MKNWKNCYLENLNFEEIWKNENPEEWKLNIMEIQKNDNLEKCKFEKCKFGKTQTWKNINWKKYRLVKKNIGKIGQQEK